LLGVAVVAIPVAAEDEDDEEELLLLVAAVAGGPSWRVGPAFERLTE